MGQKQGWRKTENKTVRGREAGVLAAENDLVGPEIVWKTE